MELATGTGFHVLSEPVADWEAQAVTPEACQSSAVVSLREEISQLIAPWRHSAVKPPFTAGEMAVFAMISSDKQNRSKQDLHFLSTEEMYASILRTFSYYNELAITAFAHYSVVPRQKDIVVKEEVVEGFVESLKDFDMPITVTLVRRPGYRTHREYAIAPNAARVYLRRCLEPAREGKFRFLDLSPELRNKIYETVLRFPDVGINFSVDKHFQLVRGDLKYHKAIDPYSEWHPDRFVTTQLLALLCTCKKIQQEASSVFYGVNTFRFASLGCLHHSFLVLPLSAQEQMQCLHICLGTDHRSFKYIEAVGNMLHRLAPKRLKFTIHSTNWILGYNQTRRYVHKGTGRYKDKEPEEVDTFEMVEELKPFIELARRAEKIEIFEQDGTAFRDFVMSQLAIQHTPSDAVQHGDWMHCVLEA